MVPCDFCLYMYDECCPDCDDCKLPEFSKDGEYYRDTCDVCGEYIMVPMTTRDNVNIILCKKCAKDISDPLDYGLVGTPYGECEGSYIEGTDKWW
jgi:hypothetical protein